MTKPDLKATVAALASVAQKTGGVFVFATRDANLPRGENVSAEIAEYPFAEHTCKTCDAVFSAVKAEGLQNHCIACGNDKTVAKSEISKPNIPQDSELSYLTCSACGTHNVFATAVGKQVASKMCCTACGTHLNYQTAADDLMDDSDTLDLDDMELIDVDDDDVDDEPEVISDAADGDGADKKEDEEKADSTSEDKNPLAPAEPLAPGKPSDGQPGPDAMENEPPNPDACAPSEPGSNPNGDPPQVQAETTEMSMIDAAAAEESLTFAYFGKQIAMISGMKIVATLSPEDAGENADVLQTDAFRLAVANVIGKKGLKEAAKAFNFKPVIVQVPVKAMVEAGVAQALAEKQAKVTAALDEAAVQFQHAVDVATAGYAANFWRGKHDPVKAALVSELSALGVPNAQKVVDRVFATHGVAQLRDVIALARDLSNKAPEALNGLAEAINLAKYVPMEVRAADGDEDGDDDAKDDEDDDSEDDEDAAVTTVATAVEVDDEPSSVTAGTNQFKDKQIAAILKGRSSIFG